MNEFSPLEEKSMGALLEHLHQFSFSKKEVFLKPETPCTKLFVIQRGAVREFFYDAKGKDVSTWFGFENDIAVGLASFISGEKGYTGFEAIEPTEGFYIHRKDLYSLYDQYPDIDRLGRRVVEHYFTTTEKYHFGFRHLSAKARYNKLIEENPSLLQRVPLIYLSSYLGVSLETLSRIRSSK